MASGSKERIEAASGDLMARHGYNGMGLKAVSQAAELPYGSIYHHFPGGKEEIAASAIASLGALVGQLLESLFASRPPDRAVTAMFDYMADRLEGSDWADGCPVGTPAQDGANDSVTVREACDAAFGAMVTAIAAALVDAGVAETPAHDLATTVIAAYEGATLLARVQRSAAPLHATAEVMATLLRTATGAATT
ncbi:MAG TPA: TetR/AcrR family transcriptional regulator [Acidimicrobiales bacterium]|nr:TetR/AcrR family transcriptional regulator [Acidimicrobiales bacterium]